MNPDLSLAFSPRYHQTMNAFDRNIDGPAVVHYGDGEFVVMKPGRYVVCAVSGKRVILEALRYWSPELQEAYAGPEEALKRWQELPKTA